MGGGGTRQGCNLPLCSLAMVTHVSGRCGSLQRCQRLTRAETIIAQLLHRHLAAVKGAALLSRYLLGFTFCTAAVTSVPSSWA